jgi:prephenate dehydratase
MTDEVQRVQYFYTEVPDKPGEGARLLGVLKEEGINLCRIPSGPTSPGGFYSGRPGSFQGGRQKG